MRTGKPSEANRRSFAAFVMNAPEPVVDTDFISCTVCAWLCRFQIVGHLLSLGFCMTCEISGFCRGVYEVLALTGCYVTYSGQDYFHQQMHPFIKHIKC